MGASDGSGPGLSRLRGDLDLRGRAALLQRGRPRLRRGSPGRSPGRSPGGRLRRPAPDNVMVSWFDDDARVSTVVGIAPEDPVFDLPSYATRMVDPAGRLRAIDLVGAVADVPPRDRACGHRVTADGFTRVRLTEPTGSGKQVARISFYTSAEGFLVVVGGRWRGVAPAAAGPQRGRHRRRRPGRRARAAPGGSGGCARRTRRCVWSASWSASRHRASGLRRRPVGPRWCRPSCPRRTDRSGSGPWCPGRRAARRRRAATGACPPGRPGRWRGAP